MSSWAFKNEKAKKHCKYFSSSSCGQTRMLKWAVFISFPMDIFPVEIPAASYWVEMICNNVYLRIEAYRTSRYIIWRWSDNRAPTDKSKAVFWYWGVYYWYKDAHGRELCMASHISRWFHDINSLLSCIEAWWKLFISKWHHYLMKSRSNEPGSPSMLMKSKANAVPCTIYEAYFMIIRNTS